MRDELQEEMFMEVTEWVASGLTKSEILTGKSYSEPKFNYWVSKWKASQVKVVGASFRELGLSAGKQGPNSTAQVARGEVVNIFGGGEKCLPVGGMRLSGVDRASSVLLQLLIAGLNSINYIYRLWKRVTTYPVIIIIFSANLLPFYVFNLHTTIMRTYIKILEHN